VNGGRFLIVNADDLGLSAGVNAGIFAAHERGIVTSASLMVRAPAAAEAVAELPAHPRLAVGLHLDLAEWRYENGEWWSVYERCALQDPVSVEDECRVQLEMFRKSTGRLPAHLDSHQHLHMEEPVATVAAGLAGELEVPLRAKTIRYEGGFYGQSGKGEPYPAGIEVEHLVKLIESLPGGWTELGCHPGLGVGAESTYGPEREQELGSLCDQRVSEAIERAGIELRSFTQFR
jgi:chitin disaccharide deacetylase